MLREGRSAASALSTSSMMIALLERHMGPRISSAPRGRDNKARSAAMRSRLRPTTTVRGAFSSQHAPVGRRSRRHQVAAASFEDSARPRQVEAAEVDLRRRRRPRRALVPLQPKVAGTMKPPASSEPMSTVVLGTAHSQARSQPSRSGPPVGGTAASQKRHLAEDAPNAGAKEPITSSSTARGRPWPDQQRDTRSSRPSPPPARQRHQGRTQQLSSRRPSGGACGGPGVLIVPAARSPPRSASCSVGAGRSVP